MSLQELSMHDNHIDVYFQRNAWMDNETNLKWMTKSLIAGVAQKLIENVIFADNVSFQLRNVFREACRGNAMQLFTCYLRMKVIKCSPLMQELGD